MGALALRKWNQLLSVIPTHSLTGVMLVAVWSLVNGLKVGKEERAV